MQGCCQALATVKPPIAMLMLERAIAILLVILIRTVVLMLLHHVLLQSEVRVCNYKQCMPVIFMAATFQLLVRLVITFTHTWHSCC